MSADRGLEATRTVREKISREHGNDPRRLVEYYLNHQRRFGDRLRRAAAWDGEAEESSEHGASVDGTTRGG